MQLKEAKQLISDGTEGDIWVGRSVTGDFVRLKDHDNFDPMLIQALKEMITSGELEQMPSAGQCRSTVSYRKRACTK